MNKKLLIFFFFVILVSRECVAQEIIRDSVHDSTKIQSIHKRPSPLLQFAVGSVVYAIPFWTLSGKTYLATGDSMIGGVILGVLASGISVFAIGNLTADCHRSYWAGVGGALIGQLFGGALYSSLSYNGASITAQYLALSLPPILCSIIIYHIFLSDENYETEPSSGTQNIMISPFLTPNYGGIRFQMRY